jgi:hypothetical protein
MLVLYSKWSYDQEDISPPPGWPGDYHRVTAVYVQEPARWDQGTQRALSLDEAANSQVTVPTPHGDQPLLRALLYRTGAFAVGGEGELYHDPELEVPHGPV